MCIVLWLIFTDWTRIWLSWQPGLCNRQKAGSEGHRRTALLHESQRVPTLSVYYCCQVETPLLLQTPPVSAVGPTGARSVWRCESPKMKLQLIVKSKLAEMHLCFPSQSSLFLPSAFKGFCKGRCFSPPDTRCPLLSAVSVFVIFSCRFLSSFVVSRRCACSIVLVTTKTRNLQNHSSHFYIPLKMASQTSRCFGFQFPVMCIAAEYMLENTVNTEQ